MNGLRCWFILLCCTGSLAASEVVVPDPLDWPYWRGPEMNGISREKNLPASWSPDGENLLWKSEALATRSTPIVMRGRLYTLCRHQPRTLQEAEKVVCADAETGEILWEHVFNAYLTDVPDTRVAWSSVVGDPETGHVFALGVCGYFVCLHGETGEVLWRRSLSEEFGMLSTYGGRTNFPIVFENLVLISGIIIGWGDMARPAHRFLAFDKRNGQCVWFVSGRPLPEDTTYSSPVITVIDGEVQYILGAGDGRVYGFQPRTGKMLWYYDVSPRGINTTPVVAGTWVICGHSEENLDSTQMGALFAIDASRRGDITKNGEIWRIREQFVGKTQPIVLGDRVYSIDDSANFIVNDLKTGKVIGRQKLGTMGRASPLYADGKFYCVDATGRWFIFTPDEQRGLKRIHQLRLETEVNGSPIVSHGRIYLPTESAMYCIGFKDTKPEADPIPPRPAETPVEQDQQPAQMLVVPVESLLKPGQVQPYKVLLYNARGQYLREAATHEIKMHVEGVGQIDGHLRYQAPSDHQAQAVIIKAEGLGLTGQARIRVIPPFPWHETFDDGVVPITGVGIRYRHIGLDFDLYQALKQKNYLAGRLYIAFATQFTNTPGQTAKYDDTTPANTWTNLKRYLEVLDTVTTQSSAQQLFDPALHLLKEEGVIANWQWTGTEDTSHGQPGPQLTLTKGARSVMGNGVLCKITTIPKGTRSQGWLGHPDSTGYEIQADFYSEGRPVGEGVDPHARMTDFGLICQRYRCDILGTHQKLKLYSWISHDQKYLEKPFAWEDDTWYTMKFRVTTIQEGEEAAALLQGKVWKRGEPEPEAWSIEWTDRPANLIGSPGLFGNAQNAELFIDNLRVTPLTGQP